MHTAPISYIDWWDIFANGVGQSIATLPIFIEMDPDDAEGGGGLGVQLHQTLQ